MCMVGGVQGVVAGSAGLHGKLIMRFEMQASHSCLSVCGEDGSVQVCGVV